MIYFTRARQTHQSLEKVITQEELHTLNEQLEGTIQFYYFIQLLGTHIHPNFETMKNALTQSSSLNNRDITDAAYSLFTMKDIVEKIMLYKIDMKDIVLHPTEENLNKALKVLEFPKKATIKSGFEAENKDIELPITQFFSLKKPEQSVSERDEPYNTGHFGYFSRNISGYSINNCLEKFLSSTVKSNYFIGLSKKATKYIVALEDRIRVFNKLVQTPQEQFNFTAKQQNLLESTYPLIFVSEANDVVKQICTTQLSRVFH